MKILGVNISHDTSVAVVEDGEVVSVYEEERSRRTKWWSPVEDSANEYEELGLLCIDCLLYTSPSPRDRG